MLQFSCLSSALGIRRPFIDLKKLLQQLFNAHTVLSQNSINLQFASYAICSSSHKNCYSAHERKVERTWKFLQSNIATYESFNRNNTKFWPIHSISLQGFHGLVQLSSDPASFGHLPQLWYERKVPHANNIDFCFNSFQCFDFSFIFLMSNSSLLLY